jgi:hypothetical protein
VMVFVKTPKKQPFSESWSHNGSWKQCRMLKTVK